MIRKLPINVGRLDQILRGGFSLLAIYFGFINRTFIDDSMLAGLLGIFGIVNLIAALIAWRPL